MTKRGARVLEYNVRFGDPETQSCLSLLRSDLAEIMLACTSGTLSQHTLDVDVDRFAATVVVAAGGYPGSYKKDIRMELTPTLAGCELFHAGTRFDGEGYYTTGGRVIASTATGSTLAKAVEGAYKGVECIQFKGMQYRKDIAARALR